MSVSHLLIFDSIFHTGILVGLFSIAHTGHLLDITIIPASRAPLIHTSLSYLNPLHLALSLILASCTALTSTTTQHIYSLTPYFYLSYDHIYFTALYVHHSYITSFLTIGSHAHTAITLVRYWITPLELESSSKQIRIHTHKAAIIPHLSWVMNSTWLTYNCPHPTKGRS